MAYKRAPDRSSKAEILARLFCCSRTLLWLGRQSVNQHQERVEFEIARLSPIGERCLAVSVARVQRYSSLNEIFNEVRFGAWVPLKNLVEQVAVIAIHLKLIQPVRHKQLHYVRVQMRHICEMV